MKKIKSLLNVMLLTFMVIHAAHAGGKDIHADDSTLTRGIVTKPVSHLFSHVATLDELQTQLKKAKQAHQPVMIEFYASWCPSCRSLDTYVFPLAQIQKLMRPFKSIRVDLTNRDDDSMQIAMYYQVNGTPTFIFYDKNGDEFNTDRFKNMNELKQVLEKLGD